MGERRWSVRDLNKSNVCQLSFSKFKKFVCMSDFAELQLMQISFNFKNYCCNLKIRGLGEKLCVTFLLF